MDNFSKFLPYAEESIDSLGYIRKEYKMILAALLSLCESHHPREVATKYRKRGEQISVENKRALGLRANAFFSVDAYNALTEKGLRQPIDAFELTLSRAILSFFRARSISNTISLGYDQVKYDGPFPDCPGCARLNKLIVHVDNASSTPPTDCSRGSCALSLQLHIDFCADLD